MHFAPSKNFNGSESICFIFGKFADMLAELSRREKVANIKPDPDIDIYMKVINFDQKKPYMNHSF